MVMFRNKNAGQNHNLVIANKPFVTRFKYLGKAVIDQTCIHEEIKFGECLLRFCF
jgi:hypothetical protein